MIISASRRTDILAFYSEWFINRLKEGFIYTKNPMNPKQISKIKLNPKSPLLIGELLQEDKIIDRKITSLRNIQVSLF
ncbi:DUF1848 family protein [Clostridium chromiireducens]|uniref:DUF1848 family protein n=1 Tax=Clostridium chromiireducens TaxID=225345 RepID=A0A964RPT1_9CLOT|nr:DUF1848 family protein [Clostridium chromiireducens]